MIQCAKIIVGLIANFGSVVIKRLQKYFSHVFNVIFIRTSINSIFEIDSMKTPQPAATCRAVTDLQQVFSVCSSTSTQTVRFQTDFAVVKSNLRIAVKTLILCQKKRDFRFRYSTECSTEGRGKHVKQSKIPLRCPDIQRSYC